MSWLLIALAAQFIIGTSAVIDKLLLKKSYPNAIGYTFWIGILGLTSLALLPFGFSAISTSLILLALVAGAAFIIALLFNFLALFKGEASGVLILIGALSPIFTLLLSSLLLDTHLSPYQFIGFLLLIIGSTIIFFVETKEVRLPVISLAIASAFFFGATITLTKVVFNNTNFTTGFIWIKIGAAIVALSFLLIPRLKRKVLKPDARDKFRNKYAYLLNRGYAGVGSVLFSYAILLGVPALVDATGSFKYIFILLGGWLVLRERFRGWIGIGKISAIIVISLGIVWLGTGDYLKNTAPNPDRPIIWGVTFSQKFSEQLGLDWKENYDAILNDLGVTHIRLVAYWDLVEPTDDEFRFDDLDYQLQEAQSHDARVILAIGQRVPRWPECHIPPWAEQIANGKPARTTDIVQSGGSQMDYKQKLLDYIETVVNRYKNNNALVTWQIENEPFLPFGECPTFDKAFLDSEIALVKSRDSTHPILITDSGEISSWIPAMNRGDIFGTTMYRRVYNNRFGQIDYHLPPEFFRIKEKIARLLTNERVKKAIVIELAAEPWLNKQIWETTPGEQFQYFDLPFFKDTISYANEAGFDEYYLWGAEWWYWLKTKQNHPEFWDYAKEVMDKNKSAQ